MRTPTAPHTRAPASPGPRSFGGATAGAAAVVIDASAFPVASAASLMATTTRSACAVSLALASLLVLGCAGGSTSELPVADAHPAGSGGGAAATGGAGTGGSGTGGAATATGGAGTGGAATGGAATGGAATGGARTGAAGATGGSAAGGGGGRTPGADGGVVDAGVDAGGDASARPDATVFPPAAGKPTVYLAGDSTVSTYAPNASDQQGWGQRLQEFFTTDVIVVNRALGGRSSKSFVDEGHLAEILAVIKPGDYLFAQWGINDRSVAGPLRATDPATTFRTYLKMYIDGARAKNAIPVLVTPTPRHQYVNGVFQNGFPTYWAAIKEVGVETNTPVIDLQTKGLAYYTMIGDAVVSSTISLDALHFKSAGALQMARLVAQGVLEINVPISPFVIQSKL